MSPASLFNGLSEEAVWRLEAACCRYEEAWQADGRPVLWEFLDAAGEDERLAQLRELLRLDLFYRRQAGEEPSLADYRARLTVDESVLREVFADTPEESGATVDAAPRQVPPSAVEPVAEPAEKCLSGRYRLLRFHAQGGLGEVHVADDAELNREVALKRMQAEFASDPERRLRFVLEGEVTGSLEHPGVVPVYGRGTQDDGRPYYTMRFIRGETLAAAIVHFHKQAGGQFDSMEFRQLLGRFLAVCQAVAYAHSRGVLHRDLKPANVMLGPFGETLVLDWGLAKILGEEEGAIGSNTPLRLAAPGGAATVGVVGTPAYMSPEQAASRTEELGPATDVYGLGATFYELLTGAAPLQGSLFDMLTNVVTGTWKPPMQVNRRVPPALDAVCRKAMALRCEDRYSSAQDLAKDLEAWLADEPVSAYPEPWGGRLRRWARKRPRQVTAAVVLLGTAVVGLTLGTAVLERSKRQAEASYQIAKQGVNHFLQEVSEDVLLDEPGMRPLRQALINEALNYHEAFLEIRPDDPDSRQQLAETYRLRGALEGEVGHLMEGRAWLTRAVEGYQGLLEARPSERGLRLGLARCWLWLAEFEVKAGEPGSANAAVSQAIEGLSALRAEEPGTPALLHLLSQCHDLRASAKARQGDLKAALEDNREARALLEQTNSAKPVDTHQAQKPTDFGVAPTPGTGAPRNLLTVYASPWSRLGSQGSLLPDNNVLRLIARVLANQGALLQEAGRTGESAPAFREAADLYGWLSRRHHGSGRFRHALALALLGVGRAEVESGRPVAGARDLREAVALLEKLCEQDSLVPEYKADLLRARGLLGECLSARGQHRAAAELLRDVVNQGEVMLQGKMRGRQLLDHHPRFLYMLGQLEAALGRPEEGLRLGHRAARQQELALAKAPNSLALRNDLLHTREALSRLRLRTGEISRDDRIEEQRQILREREELAGQDPLSPTWGAEAGASAALLASLLLDASKAQEALAVVEQVLPRHEMLLRADEDRSRARKPVTSGDLRNPHYLAQFDFGIARRHPAPPSLAFRVQLAELLALQGATRAALGRPAESTIARAIALSEESVKGKNCYHLPPWSWQSVWSAVATDLFREDPEPCHQFDLARHLALAATLPGQGIPDPAGRAIQALRDLAASGFDNAHALRDDERLAPLRSRQAFQELLRAMQAPRPR